MNFVVAVVVAVVVATAAARGVLLAGVAFYHSFLETTSDHLDSFRIIT
jgi:hypothetical protein